MGGVADRNGGAAGGCGAAAAAAAVRKLPVSTDSTSGGATLAATELARAALSDRSAKRSSLFTFFRREKVAH